MVSYFDQLRFEVCSSFDEIPRYLFEQIPKRDWVVEDLYKWGSVFMQSPLNLLFVLRNIANKVKGVLWITVDPVLKMACVNIYSIDRKYQTKNGEAIKRALRFIRENADKRGLKEKILWTTTRPKAFVRAGCRLSDRIVVEA